MAFKVGDKVRIKEGSLVAEGRGPQAGDCGTITSVVVNWYGDTEYTVADQEGPGPVFFFDVELELVQETAPALPAKLDQALKDLSDAALVMAEHAAAIRTGTFQDGVRSVEDFLKAADAFNRAAYYESCRSILRAAGIQPTGVDAADRLMADSLSIASGQANTAPTVA